MKNDNQDEVCEFVREIISARTREPIALTERPDRERRDIKAVEELWESSSRRYAVEHWSRVAIVDEVPKPPESGDPRMAGG